MNWILLLLLVGAVFVFVKATNKGQNVWSYFLVVASIFLLITLVYTSTQPGVDLSSLDGLIDFSQLYYSWVVNFIGNFATITGHATHLNWGTNSTTG